MRPDVDFPNWTSDGSLRLSTLNGSGPPFQSQLTAVANIVPRNPEWLWAADDPELGGWIPIGEATCVAGEEGVGKSTMVIDLVSRLTCGTLPGKYGGTPKGAIYLTTENAYAEFVAPRVGAAGGELRVQSDLHLRI